MAKINQKNIERLIKLGEELGSIGTEATKTFLGEPEALSVDELSRKLLLVNQQLLEICDFHVLYHANDKKTAKLCKQLMEMEKNLDQRLNTKENSQRAKLSSEIQIATFMFALYPFVNSLLIDLAKDNGEDHSRAITLATRTALGIGLGIAFRKSIMRGWRSARKITRRLRSVVDNNFTVYYFKESARDISKKICSDFRDCEEEIRFDAYYVKERTICQTKEICNKIGNFMRAPS
ncbi:MAG: hypothetical protein PHY92_08740 [Alphaproteobacteria bacterium]|nr:hypothetical protein [Alphaproteobacteria bacterium]